jgi:hypothetical protein
MITDLPEANSQHVSLVCSRKRCYIMWRVGDFQVRGKHGLIYASLPCVIGPAQLLFIIMPSSFLLIYQMESLILRPLRVIK